MKQNYNTKWTEVYTINDIKRGKHLKPSVLNIIVEWILELGSAASAAIRA